MNKTVKLKNMNILKQLMLRSFFFIMVVFSNSSILKAQFLKDIDGNTYKTIEIGTQVWMSENLKVTHFNNGTPILLASDSIADNENAYCCDYNNDLSYCKIFGKLYNFPAVTDSNKLCPLGWHVPSNDDWIELLTFLGGVYNAGGMLKSVDSLLWTNNIGATNKYKFTALPGGYRSPFADYKLINKVGCWWSSSISKYNYSNNRSFKTHVWSICNNETILNVTHPYTDGFYFSVRCVKDL